MTMKTETQLAARRFRFAEESPTAVLLDAPYLYRNPAFRMAASNRPELMPWRLIDKR
jgi:hypothetical protein